MIAIIVPVYKRPQLAAPLIANIRATTTVDYTLLFVLSPGDAEEQSAIEAAGGQYTYLDCPIGPGDYAKKINLGYRSTSEPFIFTGADDLKFHLGWDVAALKQMENPQVGVVGTNDLGNPKVLRGEHSTHSLLRRTYADNMGVVDKPGAIYCEQYHHEFVDDELVQTAKARDAWAFAMDSVVEHLHPNWGKAEPDPLYNQAPRRLATGRALYRRRQHLWGSLGPSDISVVVATYGDPSWKELAKTALASVENQSRKAKEVIYVHGDNLAAARNDGAAQATGKWLCFLDADDEFAPGYLDAMHRATTSYSRAALLNPSVQFITPDNPDPAPKLFRTRDLRQGNYLVIGTAIQRDLFNRAGGFDPQWPAWEDWALFWRVYHLRRRIARVPRAVYRANWREDGRNNTVADPEGLRQRIQEDFDRWRINERSASSVHRRAGRTS